MAPSASEPKAVPGVATDVAGNAGDASVIICTKDRPEDVARALASIRTSGDAGRCTEIIVVEEATNPREIPGVRYVHLPRLGRGYGYARNVGVQAARGDLLLFVDDDCEVGAGWSEALTAPFSRNPDLLGVAGAVLVRDCNLIGYAENILGFPGGGLRYLHGARGQVVPTRYLSTCNCAYRRSAILRAGGFPEEARRGGEDFLLAERVAALGPCVYAPNAVVYHRPRGRLAAIFTWFSRRGESEIALLTATADRGTLLRFLLRSSWTLRAVLVVALLARWPGLVPLVPAAAVLYYGAILWRFRFARTHPSHRRAWWLVPVVKFTMDIGTELGRWKALVGRKGP
jgi:GT2 family glycosyltransferase